MRTAVRRAWEDALFWVDLVQSAKTVLAGVLAWWVASDVLGLQQPFLAPWSAILVVHATVYRTFARGAQQVAATVLAVVLASFVGHVFGLGLLAMTGLLVASVLVGRLRWVRAEAPTLATTAVVVLATNSIEETLLWSRLLDTTTGIVVGLLVNVVVWPPLRDRAAWAETAKVPGQIGAAVAEIADHLTPGLDTDQGDRLIVLLRDVDVRIDQCWGLLRQAQEGSRFNPRQRKGWSPLDDLVDVLHRLEHVLADTQSLLRTAVISASQGTMWEESFRADLVAMMGEVARVVDDDDPQRFDPVLARLREVAATVSTGHLGETWQEYGGVLINLRNVVDALSYLPPTSQLRPHTGPHLPQRQRRRTR